MLTDSSVFLLQKKNALKGGDNDIFLKQIFGKLRWPKHLRELKKDLKKVLTKKTLASVESLSKEESRLLDHIREQTDRLNLNNVTRTNAYLEMYEQYPELQWAFLGHMVSRNGGWNMTDLQGDQLSRLMNETKRNQFFDFLERGNWLIFQDVFPQFLIYDASKKRQRNLFHLLPYLNVSRFMEVIWNFFWKEQDRYTLAMALVVNEQSYIEKRIVQNRKYKDQVLHTIEFVVQDVLSFNHILFPFHKYTEKAHLMGLTLHHFSSLHERILLGKRLYELLFHPKGFGKSIFHWAMMHPHTGSRKDYWPEVFNDVNEGIPGVALTRRLKQCRLKDGAKKIYSPRLVYAWEDVTHGPAERGDWFQDWRVLVYLQRSDEFIRGEIEGEYCETLEKLELAAVTKKAIFN